LEEKAMPRYRTFNVAFKRQVAMLFKLYGAASGQP
jgi:hypothetical protein